jgi:hypothetical protein
LIQKIPFEGSLFLQMESEQSYKSKGGRPPIPVLYTDVLYKDKTYTVGQILNIHKEIYFVIDSEDREKVEKYNWHLQTDKYIGSQIMVEGKRKVLYLHNLVQGRQALFPGKGAKETIDHINRNGLDNRKENLRLVSQTEQNINQTKRNRSVTLPEGCGVSPEELPRHIWYIKAHAAHGDRFGIEFKTERISWKSTSSIKVSLKEKLQSAKEKLQEYYIQYPHLNPFNTSKIGQEKSLQDSFEQIVSLVESS